MWRVYDNWERLVAAVLKREELRRIALCESFDTSISTDFSSRFSIDFSVEDASASRISSETISLLTQEIDFEELKKATKNFRPDSILGEGGFGFVYRGWIDEHTLTASKPGYGMAVAIKKWRKEGFQGRKEWLNEVKYLCQLRHPNLVKVIGYCSEEDELALIYEFMPKGSLDNHLFRGGHVSLSWVTRIKVAVDVARGLSFLHDSEKPLIHRNLSTADILLDGVYLPGKEFNAKISDCALARDGPTGDVTHVTTQVIGTYGYAAPEYVATGRLTTRCDVYDFGVVLLELLCGRRAIDRNRPSKEFNLVDWTKPYLGNKRKLSRVMDPRLGGQFSHKAAYKVATIALQCLSQMPKLRPKMAEVAAALEQL